MNKEYGLEEIHKSLIEALDELDTICRNNNIYYSLHGGALLGAERNGKLIPWDDDLDISMTRENYEKFLNVCQAEQYDYYVNEIDNWVPRFTKRIREKETVFIDIFIWDYISEKKIIQKFKILLLRTMQGMLKRNVNYSNYSLKNKLLIKTTNVIGRLLPRKTKLRFFKKIEQKFVGNKKYIHRSNDAFKGVGYIFDSRYMSEYSFVMLEGKEYMVTSRYKEFLERNYGRDYLIPPKEEERRPMHGEQRNNFMEEV